MIPILVFGMTVGIAYNQELALLLTAALGLVVVIALGQDLSAYVIILTAAATSILLVGSHAHSQPVDLCRHDCRGRGVA